jgi:hypothetical protein
MAKLRSPFAVLMLLGLADAAIAVALPWLIPSAILGLNGAVAIVVAAIVALVVLLVSGWRRFGRRALWLFIYLPAVLFWPAVAILAFGACAHSHCSMY